MAITRNVKPAPPPSRVEVRGANSYVTAGALIGLFIVVAIVFVTMVIMVG